MRAFCIRAIDLQPGRNGCDTIRDRLRDTQWPANSPRDLPQPLRERGLLREQQPPATAIPLATRQQERQPGRLHGNSPIGSATDTFEISRREALSQLASNLGSQEPENAPCWMGHHPPSQTPRPWTTPIGKNAAAAIINGLSPWAAQKTIEVSHAE